MKQYDSVFIPAESKKEVDYYMDKDGDLFGLKEQQNVIVLTIEELRELWNHCASCQVDEETDYANAINFNAYLQSKGINNI